MELSAWLSIAAVCSTGAISPGPSLAVVLKNTMAGGRRQGSLTAVGHGLGIGLYAFLAVAGLTAVSQQFPWLHHSIQCLGGLYLLWMGIQVLRHAGGEDQEEEGLGGRQGFTEGFFIAFLNPKTAVFFLALLGSFVPESASMLTRCGVALLAMAIDIVWFVFVAILVAGTGLANWLRLHAQWIDRLLAVILLGLSALVLYRFVKGLG